MSVSAVSFGDLDLEANHVGGDVSWTPSESDAGIETYETYLATDAAGSGEVLAGGVAVGTNVYAVLSDTDSTGKSYIMVYTKSTLAEQTTPAALALTDESLTVSAVSFNWSAFAGYVRLLPWQNSRMIADICWPAESD